MVDSCLLLRETRFMLFRATWFMLGFVSKAALRHFVHTIQLQFKYICTFSILNPNPHPQVDLQYLSGPKAGRTEQGIPLHSPAAFLVAGTAGLYGFAFSDFGDSHTIWDADGEAPKQYIVMRIFTEDTLKAFVSV